MLEFIQHLFQKRETTNAPILQEMLQRTAAEKYDYEIWKLSEEKDNMLDFLAQSYRFFSEKHITKIAKEIVFLENARNSGFVLTFNAKKYKTIEFQYLFDYLKEKIKEENYTNYLSDKKRVIRRKCEEITERHYLKARFNFDTETRKYHQQYGNIIIEFVKHNKKAVKIKLLCVPHNDRSWSKALPFSQLMGLILN